MAKTKATTLSEIQASLLEGDPVALAPWMDHLEERGDTAGRDALAALPALLDTLRAGLQEWMTSYGLGIEYLQVNLSRKGRWRCSVGSFKVLSRIIGVRENLNQPVTHHR